MTFYQRCSGPISRRSCLQIGGIGLGALGFSDLLRLHAEASISGGATKSDTSVILLWLQGGLPHMEMYDMKPDAPSEYRGEFRPVKTNVAGIDVCEMMPYHTKVADRFTLIRSITHDFSDHGGGGKRIMTGRLPKVPFGTVNDAPAIQTIVTKMREHQDSSVPKNILFGDPGRTGTDVFAMGAAYLGSSYTHFQIPGNPANPEFKVQNMSVSNDFAGRLGDRMTLLNGIDKLRRDIDRTGSMNSMDRYGQQAYQILTSEKARDAFDLSKESDATRDLYGRHSWGQRALMARRLVEAGSSFVTISLEHPEPDGPVPFGALNNWDCHAVNCHIFTDFRWKIGYYDQALSALIQDIYDRGLDKKVLVVAMGEFGHTPRIDYAMGTSTGVMQPGRNHWPQAQSVLVSGGGFRMGQVIGSTNTKGEMPKDRPMTPNDLWATVYRHLGIDFNHAFLDHSGRPVPILPFGEPIRELI
jgi:hypothetical protein